MEETLKRWKNYGILALTLMIALAGSFKYISSFSTVSGNVNGKEMPICSVETSKRAVALSFETAWGDEDIRQILDILKIHGIHTTFFVTGDWVEKYPELAGIIKEEGHDLANHSKSHKSMVEMDEEQQRAEIMEVHEKVKALTGADMQLFRLPYDSYDDSLIRVIEACGYYPIQWSVDSLDWKDLSANDIAMRIINRTREGSIILCHNNGKHTAEALPIVLDTLKNKGFTFVPIGELIFREGYTMDPTGRQIPNAAA